MTTSIPQPSRGGRIGLAHHIGGTTGGVSHRDRKYWGSTMNGWRDHWTPGVLVFGRDVLELLRGVGGLFVMSVDAVRFLFRRPFQAREFLQQSWFVARVALLPTLLVVIPFTVLFSFTPNILPRELGAADLSGAGAVFGAVTQIGPLVTVLIVAGAGATSMCADLGSRTIRDEIDVLEDSIRRHPFVSREPLHYRVPSGPVITAIRPLLFDVLEPNRLAVVVSSGHLDGSRNPVHTYVLRLYRHGWTGRCRPCDRPRGARIAHRGRIGHAARLPGDLRHKRQLQPVRIGGMA